MPPKHQKNKKKSPLPFLIAGLLLAAAIVCIGFFGARSFLHISWLASLGSFRNVQITLFRAGLVPLFGLVFAGLAVVHSWLGSSRERHNFGFLVFKFFFFFLAVSATEIFLRITETTIYAFMAGSTGTKDSLFFIDMAWYLFWIPLIKKLSLFLMCYFALLFVFRVSFPGSHKKIAYGKISLCLFSLFSIIFLLISYGQYLGARRTLGSDPFLGYSDLFGHIFPLAASLLWTWLFLALTIYFFRRRYRILLAGGVLTFLVLIGCNILWPFYLDKFVFAPNKTFYQNKFAGIHADNTRRAFGLDGLSRDGEGIPSQPGQSLDKAFLLDRDIFLRQIQNTQDFHNSFTFTEAFPALLNGGAYYIAPRLLSTFSSEWELRHFRDIYGYGAVIASASAAEPDGRPSYALQGLGLEGEFPLDNPEIFFAETFENYAFINTRMPLPSYAPQSPPLQEKTFAGVESIAFGFLHKIALALGERDLRTLFTKYYTPETKLLYYRKPSDLAKKILPYFDYSKPRLMYYNKALWWEMDGYSSSEDVFVAASIETPWGRKNWLRAPIKAYVNAYSGEVFFRRVQGSDPMVRVISKVFPKLFTKEINPESFSYPEELFAIQSALLERYHEADPGVFYAGINKRTASGGMAYKILKVSNRSVLARTRDYSVAGKNLFAATFTAYVGDKGLPSLHLYEASRSSMDREQALTAIRASAEYQNLLGYWRSIETEPLLGTLGSFPYQGGISYIQPIYTNAAGLNMPLLAKAVLIHGTSIVLADSLLELRPAREQEAPAPLTEEQRLSRILRDAYIYYLDAEKARIQGKPQDYQKNVEKIGEKLRQAAN